MATGLDGSTPTPQVRAKFQAPQESTHSFAAYYGLNAKTVFALDDS
jgi:hypothetical protein